MLCNRIIRLSLLFARGERRVLNMDSLFVVHGGEDKHFYTVYFGGNTALLKK